MKPSARSRRGSAMLTTAVLMTILLVFVVGLMSYANTERLHAIAASRTLTRQACVDSGLQMARAFYGRNFANWSQYLNNASVYNPVPITNPTAGPLPADPTTPAGLAAIKAAAPATLVDLDGDGHPDVYLYVRDNADEFIPTPNNPYVDADKNVIVGAMCISQTLVPRRDDGTYDQVMNGGSLHASPLAAEALLSYNGSQQQYTGQNAGGNGTGNLNN
jgi:hypothetical protein